MKKITFLLSFVMLSLVGNATFYVVPGGAGTADGSSWANAYADIQTAINAANTLYVSNSVPQEVWVKAGTYSTSTAALLMKESVSIYGGFVGTETDKTLRAKGSNAWDYTNTSTLNGGAAKRCVESAANFTNITVIDGFTITNGNGAGTQLTGNGGGVLLRANLKLQNCIVTANTTTGNGGGVNAAGGIISNCWIYGNTTTSATIPSAGGIYSSPASGISTAIDNSIIEKNAQGGLRFQGTGAIITMDKCIIRNNTSTSNGAAIYVNGAPGSCTITNCVITNNSGTNAVYMQKSKLINSTIANNEGGVYLASATNIGELYNNIIVNNVVISTTTPTAVSAATSYPSGYVKNNAVFPAIDTQSWAGATNTLLITDAATAMTDVAFKSPTTFAGATSDGVKLNEIDLAQWNLTSESKVCNFGDNTLIPSGINTDYEGKSRILFTTVDAGAYEYDGINISSNQNAADLSLGSGTEVFIKSGGTLTINSATTVKSISIATGGKLTNSSTLNTTTFNINSDATGTGTFVDNGTTTITNATVQQYLTSGRNWYVSSPVSGATASSLNTTTGTSIMSYDEIHGSTAPWITTTGTLESGKGYIVVSPTNTNPTISFGGTLTTGSKQIDVTRTTGQTKEGFNLIGNPYPSYVNWESATKTNVGPTIWYRTKNTSGTYVFDTFNGIGTNNNLSGAVTGLIPPMQAVWVRVNEGNSTGSIIFDNTMRTHATGSTTALKSKSEKSLNQQILHLQVSNGINSDEAIILFNPNASNEFDNYDSPKMSNNNVAIPEIYTMAGNEKLVINGLKSITPNETLKLGFVPGISNSFSIKATQISNFDSETKIILQDNYLNIEQDITNGTEYIFSSDIENTENRFSIKLKSTSLTTETNNESIQNSALIYSNKIGEITISYPKGFNTSAGVQVQNSLGQVVYGTSTTKSTIVLTNLPKGIYIVNLKVNNFKTTRKVVVN